jgi:hypothetical protein
MKNEGLPLVTTCAPQSKHSEPPNKSPLIREWIVKLALNAGQALDPDAIGVYTALWSDGFEDLPFAVLEAAFQKTLRECKFWPVKVSDIREHVRRAEGSAASAASERAWQLVLDLRREHWNPDIPGPLDRAVARLSERVRQAARASGVFRDHETVDSLQVWAKKRFAESFISYGELEQDRFLLPDGEIKNLLMQCPQTNALPAPSVDWGDLRKHGLDYAESVKAKTAAQVEGRGLLKQLKSLREQMSEEESIAINEELRQSGARFAAALERHRQESTAENPA